jgi:hypothetical protein
MLGYYDNGKFMSSPCSQGCVSCSSATTCQQCFPDYHLNTNSQCDSNASSSSLPVGLIAGTVTGALVLLILAGIAIRRRLHETP